MEALGSLIDLVGANLGNTHPRFRNWTIFKRPRDFFSKFAKYEQAVKDGQVYFFVFLSYFISFFFIFILEKRMTFVLTVQHVILEELHPTGNESEQPYYVGVDTDLLAGPQYVPDNYEEDNGQQRLDDEVENVDNDGGQSRPKQKKDKPVKRKMSPRKQKITSRTKRQRTSGDTSPVS